jgi:hypothetical protein
MSNKAALDKGFKKAKEIIFAHLYNQCINLCDTLVNDALSKREFQSFTGNTITSFACGIYIDGALNYLVASGQNMEAPVHAKVQEGELVYLAEPYEGKARSVRGKVGIAYNLSGMETSYRILQSMHPSSGGLSIIMTTGTEYSTYLEGVYHLNVLSETAKDSNVKKLLYSSFKPLP